jgi:hypothetical protein
MSENITAVLNIVANDQASNALKQVKDTTKKQKDEVERLIASTKRLVDRQNKHKNVLDQLKLAQNNATDAQKAQLAMLHQQISANQKANGSLRMIRGGFGQMGHQVQDVAVQLQTGTDAMIVFGQQGSQIVSLFGPGGAMIGALLAVGAAIFSGVTMMSREARKEIEELTDTVTEQRKELGLLTAAELELEKLQKRKQIDEQIKKQEKLTNKIARTERMLAALKEMFERDSESQMVGRIEGDLTPALQGLQRDIDKTNEKLIQQQAELAGVAAAADPNIEQTIKAAERERERIKSIDDLIMRMREESAVVGFSARKKLEYQLAVLKVDDVERKLILTMFDKIDAHEKAQKAAEKTRREEKAAAAEAKRKAEQEKARFDKMLLDIENFTLGKQGVLLRDFEAEKALIENATIELIGSEEARNQALLDLKAKFLAEKAALEEADRIRKEAADKKALADQQRIQQGQERIRMQTLSSAQTLASGLLSLMKEGSTAYKAIFAAQQALAIAQTIINTEKAAIEALAFFPGPKGIAYSNFIRGMGYASVGVIAAQTAASFEGGGFTGRGSRSGGVDGRGGFPAILHPNETVIDHEGGGMQPVVVNQTINVTTGVQQTVRAEVANLLPQISEAAKAAVAEGRMRGGSYGSAMGI